MCVMTVVRNLTHWAAVYSPLKWSCVSKEHASVGVCPPVLTVQTQQCPTVSTIPAEGSQTGGNNGERVVVEEV